MSDNQKNAKPKPTAKRYPRFTVRLGDLTAPLEKRAASESKSAGRRVTPSAILKQALRTYLGGNYVQVIEAQPNDESYACFSALVRCKMKSMQIAGERGRFSMLNSEVLLQIDGKVARRSSGQSFRAALNRLMRHS